MDNTRERLLEVAKAFVTTQSWPWIEPVEVRLSSTPSGERAWSIRTNVQARGRNVRLLIREADFTVIESAYLAR
jgi:hypothetical protein